MDKQYFRELEFGTKEKILSEEQKNQLITELQDKLSRRNMQIKELKTQLEATKIEVKNQRLICYGCGSKDISSKCNKCGNEF